MLKRCESCEQRLPISDFPSDGKRTRHSCKECFNKLRRDRRAVAATDRATHASARELFDETSHDVKLDMAQGGDERAVREIAERQRRRESDFDAMKPLDFDNEYNTSVSNDNGANAKKTSARAASEKRQEFNASMGAFATDLRDAAVRASQDASPVVSHMPAARASYVKDLAEQERRYGNRRWARSISIAEAHEQMSREQMIYVAETYFRDKVEPVGYARFVKPAATAKRTACLLLSDLHLGSDLDALDEPVAFGAIQEARRLEFILREFIDFKPQYRDKTTALVIINGDIIEGMLLHDMRSGAPLAEQKTIFWKLFLPFISLIAAQYPSVHIECQPGNHGRDKLRHPGRATTSKWDSHEFSMYVALKMMCAGLKNVTWSIPFRAVSIVDLHGAKLGVTHADTELKLGDPDTKSRENAASLDKVNATRIYGVEFDGWVFGHYHKARYQPRTPKVLWNAALVPPNGHARTSGYIDEPQGQFIWESVEGHIFGDVRFLEVGRAQDEDERLGKLIEPFRFSMHDERRVA